MRMGPRSAFLLACSAMLVVAHGAAPAPRQAEKRLHPDFALLDAEGANVLASGRAVSTMKSCGQCHDTGFIASHMSHADLAPGTFAQDGRTPDAGPGPFARRSPQPAPATTEVNCFVCHLDRPNLAARSAAIRAGRFAEANTATLSGAGIVEPSSKGWKWDWAAFTAAGLVKGASLALQSPADSNCAACHGEVHPDSARPLQIDACGLDSALTATTGQVIASQRISASALNLAGKARLNRSWDIHAERQLQCTGCHYSRNNPARGGVAAPGGPAHLRHDPRKLDIGAYLQRPDHDFVRGPGAGGCTNCHDAAASHAAWLPYTGTHMARLACESCHVPRMHAPAIESYDWTVVAADGSPVQGCRGVDGPPDDVRSLVTGFEPVLLGRRDAEGGAVLAPYNLVTTFYWVHDDAGGRTRPVPLAELRAAFLEDGAHAAAIVAVFDRDRDGRVGPAELRIDTVEKQAAVKTRLEQLGLRNVRMEGKVQPFGIQHNVTRGEHAVNECRACHAAASRVTQAMKLTAFAPVMPALDAGERVVSSGDFVRRADGALFYQPAVGRDGLYVFGASRLGWVDGFGALAFAGTLFGAAGHGALRYLASRRRPREQVRTRRVRMYDAYRRFWHWLQAISVVALLVTGLVIHRPDVFAAISFSGAASLHNILAAILVANAALSLFYHIATQRLREYIPRPYGFIDDSIRQARYYVSGIFRGEPHPFEKRPDDRMNPIQKLTYFGILNVLLPLQIVTGALIWGVQRWPQAAGALGGLPLLATLHSLVAWLFACFIVGHVYLTTTGTTPLEAIRGMVTGDEEVEVGKEDENGKAAVA
ncbi:MAG: cytochrome b/b6 domain-containing protein [Burkholderiales bacterium]|nr:cytochrome b/b6 domain-containing protein [Burkholderiales bacterium]